MHAGFGRAQLFLLALICTTCDDEHAAEMRPVASAAPAAPTRELVLQAELVAPSAFDLIAVDGGAALAWGSRDGKLRVVLVDPRGQKRGGPIEVAHAPGLRELSAASRADRLAIAWLAEDRGRARVHAALGDAATGAFGPAALLDDAEVAFRNGRGHLAAAAAEDGRLLVFYRAKSEACGDNSALRCARFGFRELDVGGSRARGLPLSVPLACDVGVGGYAVVGQRWYYGVCSRQTGTPTTTIFSVQPEPMYASAVHTLAGCTPLGMTRLGSDVVAAGRCGSARRAVRLSGAEGHAQPLSLDTSIRCAADSLLLEGHGEDAWTHRAGAPADRLELLLPAALAPDGARALWTGRTLLVAQSVGLTLELKRGCPEAG